MDQICQNKKRKKNVIHKCEGREYIWRTHESSKQENKTANFSYLLLSLFVQEYSRTWIMNLSSFLVFRTCDCCRSHAYICMSSIVAFLVFFGNFCVEFIDFFSVLYVLRSFFVYCVVLSALDLECIDLWPLYKMRMKIYYQFLMTILKRMSFTTC